MSVFSVCQTVRWCVMCCLCLVFSCCQDRCFDINTCPVHRCLHSENTSCQESSCEWEVISSSCGFQIEVHGPTVLLIWIIIVLRRRRRLGWKVQINLNKYKQKQRQVRNVIFSVSTTNFDLWGRYWWHCCFVFLYESNNSMRECCSSHTAVASMEAAAAAAAVYLFVDFCCCC